MEEPMYKIGLITDQVSMDFEEALKFIREEGLEYIEIHALWDKNIEELGDEEAARAKKLADAHGLKVSNISSTLFLQCHLEDSGAGFEKIDDYFITIHGDERAHLGALERCIRLAGVFGCD